MVSPVRLVVVNDFEIVVKGIEAMLRPFADRVLVTESVTGEVPQGHSDLALYDDFGAGRVDPPVSVEAILQDYRARRLVLYTWRIEAVLNDPTLSGPISALVSKAVTPEALVRALEETHAEVALSEPGTWSSAVSPRSWPGRDQGLSERQAETLALIAQGLDDQQIADRAFLSVTVVESHVRSACRQIGVTRRSEAAVWAVEHGFPTMPRRG